MKVVERTFDARQKDKSQRLSAVENRPVVRIPPGTVIIYAGQNIPAGYKRCNGAYYDREDEVVLFNAIGTTFGTTTASNFRVPTMADPATSVHYLIKT